MDGRGVWSSCARHRPGCHPERSEGSRAGGACACPRSFASLRMTLTAGDRRKEIAFRRLLRRHLDSLEQIRTGTLEGFPGSLSFELGNGWAFANSLAGLHADAELIDHLTAEIARVA